MTAHRIFGAKLGLALAILALLSGVSPVRRARAAPPQAISMVDVATSWLYALKRGDTRMLDKASVYPFELRIVNAPCSCEGGKARDATELEPLLGALMKSEDVKALEVTSSDAKEVSKGSLPSWAKRFGKRLPKGARLVQVESSGGPVHTITYVLVVTDNRVRGVWLNAATDGGT